MIKDQNRIELKIRRGIYEEFTLRTDNTGYCLPGTLVAMTSDEQTHATNSVDSQADDLDAFETLVVLENALLGKTINAKSYNGERILCRRAVSGDMYLLRAVPGEYKSGNPVYATQTPNGIYVTLDPDGKFVGWAQESFTVTTGMVDLLDDSTREAPSTINLNGAIVNLLRVRIGNKKKKGEPVSGIKLTVTPPSDPTMLRIDLTRTSVLTDAGLTPASFVVGDFTVTGATATNWTQVPGEFAWTFDISGLIGNSITVTVNKAPQVTAKPKTVYFTKTPPPPAPVGYWGVAYNHLTTPPPFTTITPPTESEFLALTATNVITGSKRNMTVSFDLNETDWRAATGDTTSPYPSAASGRAFFITQTWGTPIGVVTSGFPALSAFDPFTITINGTVYSGLIANGAPPQYDGTPYDFQFV